MVLPLIILAIPTVLGGFIGIDSAQKGYGLNLLFDWLISISRLFSEANKHFENLTEILISSIPSLSSISYWAINFPTKFMDNLIIPFDTES